MRASLIRRLLVVFHATVGLVACGGSPHSGSSLNNPDAGADAGPIVGGGNGGAPAVNFDSGSGNSGGSSSCAGDACAPVDAGPLCGNSVIETGETCDDGNAIPGDGCSGLCQTEPNFTCPTPGKPCVSTIVCGDGKVSGSEACDDGNTVGGDGCAADCLSVEPGYACGTPGQACVPVQTTRCGDGQVNAGEGCDDGNVLDGDGCTSNCQIEAGYQCPTPGQLCTLLEYCGDGRLAANEQCDDGNTTPGDGCTGACQIEPFFTCLVPGQPCQTTIVCGDGKVIGDEACDDGNTVGGDGCSADCKSVEAGYTCPTSQGVGGPCTKLLQPQCGDGILSYGEFCDDGNTTPNDGCDATCHVEPGYTCPTAGQACKLISWCGDGKLDVTAGEQCDDGNTTGGDGCSSTCIQEANYTCPTPGQPCVSTVKCGDKIVSGAETCDDGNLVNGDGCSATCQVEPGWVCPLGGVCKAKQCGDGIVAGFEQCDDRNTANNDGCSSTCQLEAGYKCSGSPSVCTKTTCGDGKTEGTEQCDDGNHNLGDGCTPLCTREPSCIDASGNRVACTSSCGDGIKFPNEQCDDGNTKNGDGCSSTCTIEPGFTCSVPSTNPAQLVLPIVYHDFAEGAPYPGNSHPDFRWDWNDWHQNGNYWNKGGANSVTINTLFNVNTGAARTLLGNNSDLTATGVALTGKPIFGFTTCPLSAGQLVRNNINYCAPTHDSADSFSQWYRDTTLNKAVVQTLTLNQTANNTYLFDSSVNLPDGSTPTTPPDGLFPLDAETGTFATKYADCQNHQHNFLFTSEVHYWFQYNSSLNATLNFTGDDDVWVFVNGHLVVDIGGVHSAASGSVTIGTATRDASNNLLNLVNGNIYEIIVFQAERNPCASNYKLELQNFLLKGSTCTPVCGDGIVTPTEACDNGANNAKTYGSYGTCQPDCTWGPRCGDATVQSASGEQCDDGTNLATYGGTQQKCGPNCKWASYCGDGVVDGAYGEECDLGTANNTGAYGGCTASCKLAPRCGDGVVSNGEQCDDGIKNGTPSSSCDSTCHLLCGNGKLDAGEQCDNGSANNTGGYGKCNANCTLGARCGDGIKNGPEQCDDGKNDGSYGTCAPGCVLGPRCGDGVLQPTAGEQCDNGSANSATAYGANLCTNVCRNAPYCGDKAVDSSHGEVCDDGVNSGQPGSCTTDCTAFVPLASCGDGKVQAPEQCDDGKALNGTSQSTCDAHCHFKCGNGFKDPGEQCDNGVNDGSYGTCMPNCTLAGYCGDGVKNGPEQCDQGASNDATAYGTGKCTTSCLTAPYCGDGRVQSNFGEQCDGTVGCGSNCQNVGIH